MDRERKGPGSDLNYGREAFHRIVGYAFEQVDGRGEGVGGHQQRMPVRRSPRNELGAYVVARSGLVVVSAGFQAVHVALPLVQNKQLRFLAVASKERIRVAPQLPTLIEEGLPVEADFWYGLFAPAGTSRAIVERYNNEINDIFRVPRIGEKLDKQGLTVVGGTPEYLGEFIAQDIVKWQNVIKEAGITAE
jgi:hypothetical protein